MWNIPGTVADNARNTTPGNDSHCREELIRQSFFRSPVFIVLVALLLRLAVIGIGHTYRITPRRDHFQFGWEMGRIARSLAAGQGFASPTDLPTGPSAWEAPLYPYLMAGVFKLFGAYSSASGFVILAINSVFSALTCLTIYGIGMRLFGPIPANWAAWTWALFPYAIYWPVRVVWETSLSAFLLSLVFLLSLRLVKESRRSDWLTLGVLWGLIALTNPTMLSFLPFSLGWIWWKLRVLGKKPTLNVALVLVLCVAVMAPWLARNYLVFGRFIFVRDNFGMELHLANNEVSGGKWTRSEHPGNDPQQMKKFQEVGELPYMQAEQRAAFDFIRAHPGQFLRYCSQRAVYFWIGNPQETLVGSWNLGLARHLAFFLSAAAAFVGLWLCFRNQVPCTFLFACLMILFPIPYYIAHPSPRYRHAIEPEMVLLIVYALWQARGCRIEIPNPGHRRT
ncbi:MAG TPA: glycosyltransferase family 39 protein [Terriglobales bacterium]|nr:glycosyltransferase family 39 protein [Terriglobales bacterium]